MVRTALLIGTLLLSATNVAQGAGRVKVRKTAKAANLKSGQQKIKSKSKLTLRRSGVAAVLIKKGKVTGEPHQGAKILNNQGSEQAVGSNSNGLYVISRKGKMVGGYFSKLKQLPNGVLTGIPVATKRGWFGSLKSSNEIFLVNRKTGQTMGEPLMKVVVKDGRVLGITKATRAVVELDPKTGARLQLIPNAPSK